MGSTQVSYLRGVGARAAGTVVATMAAITAGMAGALWLAVAATVGGCAAVVTAAVSGLGLDPPTRGGEEWRTHGLKLCPPHVLTMPRPEKGRI